MATRYTLHATSPHHHNKKTIQHLKSPFLRRGFRGGSHHFNLLFMKHFFTLFLLALGSAAAMAQNQVPGVSISLVLADTVQHRITIDYLLNDPENDALNIELKVSDNNGVSYGVNVPIANLTGNWGYPLYNGNKQLVYNYGTELSNSTLANWKVKLVADDFQPINLQSLVEQVDTNNLINSMAQIEGIRHYVAGATHLQAVKDTIKQRFTDAGLTLSTQLFTALGAEGENIIGTLQGQTDDSKVLIVDAHFDSVEIAPGADDNGSGVVGMLEAMRILSQYHFDKTIKFIGFDLEEPGLIGSSFYVNGGGILPNEHIDGVLNFEMIGYYNNEPNTQEAPAGFSILFPSVYNELVADQFRGNFITNVANTASNSLGVKFDSIANIYVPQLKVVSITTLAGGISDLRRSDHAKFWDAGYQALMLTDGADFRNQAYHTANDVSSILNYNFMGNTVKATVATIANLAGIRHSSEAVSSAANATGINTPHKSTLSVVLQPNPAQNQTTLQIKGNTVDTQFNVQIYNEQACLVQNYTLLNSYTQTINTQNLPNGIYWVRVTANNMFGVSKLVVNR